MADSIPYLVPTQFQELIFTPITHPKIPALLQGLLAHAELLIRSNPKGYIGIYKFKASNTLLNSAKCTTTRKKYFSFLA
jgi:hypothetical protein